MMKSLFLERGGKLIHMGDHESVSQINAIITDYRDNNHIPNYYMRYINEEKNGRWMTCVDFGLWSEFFYIYPALNLSEEFTKEESSYV